MGTPHIGMGRDMSIFQIGESPYRYGVHSNLGTNIYTKYVNSSYIRPTYFFVPGLPLAEKSQICSNKCRHVDRFESVMFSRHKKNSADQQTDRQQIWFTGTPYWGCILLIRVPTATDFSNFIPLILCPRFRCVKGTDGIQSLRRNYVSPSRPYLGMMPWRSSEARGTILSTMASISSKNVAA